MAEVSSPLADPSQRSAFTSGASKGTSANVTNGGDIDRSALTYQTNKVKQVTGATKFRTPAEKLFKSDRV